MTGTPRVVKSSSTPPQRAPQETVRPKRRSASRATLTRASRVSLRNREIRALRACGTRAFGGVSRELGLVDLADDQDLVGVGSDGGGRLVEPLGQAAGEPAGDFVIGERVGRGAGP
jgi:hypothetical protein